MYRTKQDLLIVINPASFTDHHVLAAPDWLHQPVYLYLYTIQTCGRNGLYFVAHKQVPMIRYKNASTSLSKSLHIAD